MNIPLSAILKLHREALRLMYAAPAQANKTKLPEALGEVEGHLNRLGLVEVIDDRETA